MSRVSPADRSGAHRRGVSDGSIAVTLPTTASSVDRECAPTCENRGSHRSRGAVKSENRRCRGVDGDGVKCATGTCRDALTANRSCVGNAEPVTGSRMQHLGPACRPSAADCPRYKPGMDRPRRKSGPKPKGDRFRVTAALPSEVVTIADEIAEREGVDRTAVLGRLLCERLGLPVPAYCRPPNSRQEELPLIQAS